jgi:EmrB/QacA subfamily drug resistance transporter
MTSAGPTDRPSVIVEGELDEPYLPAAALAVHRAVRARPGYRWLVLVTVLSGLFATGLTITILTTAVPFIRRDFGSSLAAVSWVVSAPFLVRSIFVPTFGRVADLAGRRRTWLVGFAVSTTFAFLCGFAPSIGTLVLFRLISAGASAAVLPSSLALIAEAFDPEDRVKAMGWWSATIAVSPLAGVIAGGFVVEDLGWRWLFYAQFPFGVVAFLLGAVVLHESRGEVGGRFDVAGSVLSMVGLGALLLAVNRGPTGAWDWTSPIELVTISIALLALVAFVRTELRLAEPLFPVTLFRRRRVAAALGANFFTNFAYMGGFFITSLMLADLFDYRADQVALGISPRAAALGVMGPIGGYLAARYGGRRMATLGMISMILSMLALATLEESSAYLAVLPGLVLSGFGLGLVAPPSAATVANEAAEENLAAASASLNLGASLGSALGIATMQAVLLTVAASGAHPGAGAYSAAFLFGAGASVLGLVAAVNLGPERRRGRRPRGRPDDDAAPARATR